MRIDGLEIQIEELEIENARLSNRLNKWRDGLIEMIHILAMPRGNGKTTQGVKGVANANNPCIYVVNSEFDKSRLEGLINGNDKVDLKTLSEVRELKGDQRPITFDHYALAQWLRSIINESS